MKIKYLVFKTLVSENSSEAITTTTTEQKSSSLAPETTIKATTNAPAVLTPGPAPQ